MFVVGGYLYAGVLPLRDADADPTAPQNDIRTRVQEHASLSEEAIY